MVQRYFIDRWLLPCERSEHGIADPRQIMALAIIWLCPPHPKQGCNIKMDKKNS
jgi:hypothetical protein